MESAVRNPDPKDVFSLVNLTFDDRGRLLVSQALHSEYLAAALCCAVNRWITADWLDYDPRLRASIVVPAQNPQ